MSPPTAHSARPPLAILVALALTVLLAALDQTIVATALPQVAGDLDGVTQLAWVVTAYLLASTVATPLYGKLGDVIGRKRVLIGAVVVFLAGSALAGAAQSMLELILFRALQGLGAGGLIVTAMAVIADLVPPRERARYFGLIGGVFAVASVAGPLLGGFFVDNLSWRWIFYVNVPVGGAALVAIVAKLPAAPRRGDRKAVDVLGAALLSIAASAIVLVTAWGGTEYAWASVTIMGLAAAGALALAGFVATERRAADPVVPLELFARRPFAAAAGSGFLVGMSMFGVVTFLPLYLQVVDGATATEAGLRLLPFVIGSLLATTISGRLIAHSQRYRAYPAAGSVLMAGGLVLLSRLHAGSSAVLTALDMVVVGLGIGLVMQVVILVAQNHAPRRHMGVATSTASFARAIGASIGVAVFGAIFASRLATELAALPPAARGLAGAGARLDPGRVAALPPAVKPAVIDAFASAIGHTFVVGSVFAAAALVSVLLLPRAIAPDAPAPAQRKSEGKATADLGISSA